MGGAWPSFSSARGAAPARGLELAVIAYHGGKVTTVDAFAGELRATDIWARAGGKRAKRLHAGLSRVKTR